MRILDTLFVIKWVDYSLSGIFAFFLKILHLFHEP